MWRLLCLLWVAGLAHGQVMVALRTLQVDSGLTITTSSLPVAIQNAAYSQSLTASGGTTPYAWSLSGGSLCTGLSLGSNGVISGTPTVIATCNFTAKVQDAAAAADTRPLSITVVSPAQMFIKGVYVKGIVVK